MPAPPHRPPLSALLSMVHGQFVAEYEARLAEAGFADVSLAHTSNVLRHLPPGRSVRTTTLVRLSGITKQAISQQIAHLVARGYVIVAPDPDDTRGKRLSLTTQGEAAAVASRRSLIAQERSWHRRYGADNVRNLRATLEGIVFWTDHEE